MQLLKLSLSSVPIWIKLHNLPMEFWTSTCLSFVASGVGKPLCADSITEEQCHLGFARVLVEVTMDSDFPQEVEIIDVDGKPINVSIGYPWLLTNCKKCKSFDHASYACRKIEKQVWVPSIVPATKDFNQQRTLIGQKAIERKEENEWKMENGQIIKENLCF
jgi:hypothetical protein